MKKIKYLIVSSAFLGALSGTLPPMFINAKLYGREILNVQSAYFM